MLCVRVWAGTQWQDMNLPVVPGLQIAVSAGQAVAVSSKRAYSYRDDSDAWIYGTLTNSPFPTLYTDAHSAYLQQYESVSQIPPLPGAAPWPMLDASYPLGLAEDSLRQYVQASSWDLRLSDKAQPGWKSATTSPLGAFNSIVALGGGRVFAGSLGGVLSSEGRWSGWTRVAGLPAVEMRVKGSQAEGVFALGNAGGYHSKDGSIWEPLFPAGSKRDGLEIAGALASGDTIWLAHYESTEGILRSVDGGKTWAAYNSGLVAVPSDQGGFLYQGGELGKWNGMLWLSSGGSTLYRSLDGGVSWARATTGLPSSASVFLRAGDSLYALDLGGSKGQGWTFRTAGNRWEKSALPPILNGEVRAASSGDTAWLATGSKLYRRLPGTNTWEERKTPLKSLGSYVQSDLKVSGEDVFLMASPYVDGGLQYSQDGGLSWQVQRPFFRTAVFKGMYVAGYETLLRAYPDSASLHPLATDTFPDNIRYVGAFGDRLVVRAGHFLYSASDAAGPWAKRDLPDTSMALGAMQGRLVGMTAETQWVSNDAGATWTRRPIHFPKPLIRDVAMDDKGLWCLTEDSFLAPSAQGMQDIAGIEVPTGRLKMALMNSKLYLSGVTPGLEEYDEDRFGNYFIKKRWSAADLGNSPVTALYAADGFFALALGNGTLRISHDSAVSLTELDPGLGPILSLSGRADSLFALASGHVYSSADGGRNWNRRAVPDSLSFFKAENGLWLGWTGGDSLTFSTDGGTSWNKEPSPVPAGEATALALHDGTAILGTRSYGVYRRELVSPVAISREAHSPATNKGARSRLHRSGWVFGEDPEKARDLSGRRTLP